MPPPSHRSVLASVAKPDSPISSVARPSPRVPLSQAKTPGPFPCLSLFLLGMLERHALPFVVPMVGAIIRVVQCDLMGMVMGVIAGHHTPAKPQVATPVVRGGAVATLVPLNPLFSTPVTPVMSPYSFRSVAHGRVRASSHRLEDAWSVVVVGKEGRQSGFGPCLLQAGAGLLSSLLNLALRIIVPISLFGEGRFLGS